MIDTIKIKELITEIELLSNIDEKYKLNHWYIENDDMRMSTYIFKVLKIDDNYIYYKSIKGIMETIDPQETETPSFEKKSRTYEISEELTKEKAIQYISSEIKNSLS